MRMIMIKEKDLDELVEVLKLQLSDKVRHISQYESTTGAACAAEQMERNIVYHLCKMVDKIKEA